MKARLHAGIGKLFACSVARTENSRCERIDLREEYANAFRTESYNEFWTRVLELDKGNLRTHRSMGSTTAARLPSYRLFAEHLLDPDQSTVNRILDLTANHPKHFSLLCNYFSNTAGASQLCGLLLKDIDHTRRKYQSVKAPFGSSQSVNEPCSQAQKFPMLLTRVTKFSKSNPFAPSAPSQSRFRAVQASCSDLLKRLEARRDKVQAKLRLLNKLKCGSTAFLVAITTSLAIIIAAHAFVMLVAAPGIVATSLELASTKKLARWSAQLDAATKGTYILIRDLDMISRLVARLNDEMEHVHGMVRLWLGRGDDRLQANGEVAGQFIKNDQNFVERLDELEEHLYLCFMTINRARNLVVKEILNYGSSPSDSNI